MIRYLTAGESHGKALTAVIDGFPSNVPISAEKINSQLARRQSGYGRGARMLIETDKVEILSGIRHGKSLGSPITLQIVNKDSANWGVKMAVESVDEKIEKVVVPRPGHADLNGLLKYNFDDIRNSIERSSARETASRVAVGSVAKQFLEYFGISVGSYVESIGGIYPAENFLAGLLKNDLTDEFSGDALSQLADESQVRVLEQEQEDRIVEKIKLAKKTGDTLGGTFIVIATGLPQGLGSFVQYDTRLEVKVSAAIMSIPAVKGVEIGLGFNVADEFGSSVHDEIVIKNEMFTRRTNKAGGIEGGISTGLPIIVRSAMKPIATLNTPLESIDLTDLSVVESRRERSDFTAVPACAVIAEAELAIVILQEFLKKYGGDSLEEISQNYRASCDLVNTRSKKGN